MGNETMTIKIVEKEDLKAVSYPSEEVLSDEKQRRERLNSLEMAVMYGNTAYYKVKILFKDNEGTKAVNTTIWSVRDGNVTLKGGVKIPIHRILSVTFP